MSDVFCILLISLKVLLISIFLSAERDRKAAEHLDLAGVPLQRSEDAAPLPSSPETKKKSKGFRKFFGRRVVMVAVDIKVLVV